MTVNNQLTLRRCSADDVHCGKQHDRVPPAAAESSSPLAFDRFIVSEPPLCSLFTLADNIDAAIALSIRSTNVYEEQTMGLYEDEDNTDREDARAQPARTYIAHHARKQLAFGWRALDLYEDKMLTATFGRRLVAPLCLVAHLHHRGQLVSFEAAPCLIMSVFVSAAGGDSGSNNRPMVQCLHCAVRGHFSICLRWTQPGIPCGRCCPAPVR